MSKTKKVLCALAVVLLAVLAGVWCRRPVPIAQVADSVQATALDATLSQVRPVSQEDGSTLYQFDRWDLDTAPGTPAWDALWNTMAASTCRGSMLNLFPRESYTLYGGGQENVLSLTLHGGGQRTDLIFRSGEEGLVLIVQPGNSAQYTSYRFQQETFDALSALVRQYGVPGVENGQ